MVSFIYSQFRNSGRKCRRESEILIPRDGHKSKRAEDSVLATGDNYSTRSRIGEENCDFAYAAPIGFHGIGDKEQSPFPRGAIYLVECDFIPFCPLGQGIFSRRYEAFVPHSNLGWRFDGAHALHLICCDLLREVTVSPRCARKSYFWNAAPLQFGNIQSETVAPLPISLCR